ncbi:unnamed protein product, partial [marine sediment metagenome]
HNFYQSSLAADKSLKVLNYIDEFKLKIRSEGCSVIKSNIASSVAYLYDVVFRPYS